MAASSRMTDKIAMLFFILNKPFYITITSLFSVSCVIDKKNNPGDEMTPQASTLMLHNLNYRPADEQNIIGKSDGTW